MAHWSSGQDIALSRRKQGFDSPMGHQKYSQTGVWLYFCLEGESNPGGLQRKKTVWYTVFSCKSLSGSESQSVCRAKPLQTAIPLVAVLAFVKRGVPRGLQQQNYICFFLHIAIFLNN